MVFDSLVSGNVATNGSGGAVFADTDQVGFSGSTVSNNRAAIDGGAVYATTDAGFTGDETFRSQSLRIETGNFTGNTAGERGGAVYAFGYQVSLDSASFVSNSAVSGGAVFVEANESGISSLTSDATTFENNTAQGDHSNRWSRRRNLFIEGYHRLWW